MRKRLRFGEPPPELCDFQAWGDALGVFVGEDLTPLKLKTLADQRAATKDRWECYREWCAARRRFAAEFGWPGGELRREREEGAVHVGAPFDPADV